jgi:hypothetical protein
MKGLVCNLQLLLGFTRAFLVLMAILYCLM